MQMIERAITPVFRRVAGQYPVVTLTGPRQCGKTTLARHLFPDWDYVNMESPLIRAEFRDDPQGFLNRHAAPCIFDEIQNTPELASYLQVIVDERRENGLYILTGSHQPAVRSVITQSLAGRTAMLQLLPLSMEELAGAGLPTGRDELLLRGFLPRLYNDLELPAYEAYENYYMTYVERDVSSFVNLRQASAFDTFMRLLAGRIGQEVNYSSLSGDTGVSVTTVREWMSILTACYIIYPLQPYFVNAGKRLVKSPKIYFTEPGLAAYLLKIHKPEHVAQHPLVGNLFENMVVSELLKAACNRKSVASLYFYRDKGGLEVDAVIDSGAELTPVEIKSAYSYNSRFTDNIAAFRKLYPAARDGAVVYSGEPIEAGAGHPAWCHFTRAGGLLP